MIPSAICDLHKPYASLHHAAREEDIGGQNCPSPSHPHRNSARVAGDSFARSSNAGALACMRKAISNDSINAFHILVCFKIVQKALIHRLDKIDFGAAAPLD